VEDRLKPHKKLSKRKKERGRWIEEMEKKEVYGERRR